MLPRILTLSTCVSACPAKCICVSLPEDFLWLVPSLPTMWSLGELPPLPGSVPLLGPAVCCGWLLPLVPTVCEGWLRASFPKVISVKSAKEGVFTPWKWANTTHQGFFFFFFFWTVRRCRQTRTWLAVSQPGFSCRIQLWLSRVVMCLMVHLPLPALPHLFYFPHHVSFSSQMNHLHLHSCLRVCFCGNPNGGIQ